MPNEETPKDARVRSGLTQEALARRARVSLATVVRAERNNKWPVRPKVLKRYRKALGLVDAVAVEPAAATAAAAATPATAEAAP